MNGRIIVFTVISFLLISSVFLSMAESKQTDLDSKNIWMIYFSDPKDTSLDFTIENHSENKNFHWEIFINKTRVQDGDTVVSKGETKTIPVSAKEIKDRKITITVTENSNKKELYKNL